MACLPQAEKNETGALYLHMCGRAGLSSMPFSRPNPAKPANCLLRGPSWPESAQKCLKATIEYDESSIDLAHITEQKGGNAMNRFAMKALLLLSVFGLGNTALAAGNAVSTAMQMSFVVQESCTVQTPDGSKAAPAVSCAHQAPVQVSAAAADRSAAIQAAPSQSLASVDGGWQIYF